MSRRYAVLDVFTDLPLTGNPLAVVLDSDGLDDKRMQAIAREFNLSETVFVGPSENPVHTARMRIFTPAVELPFAGHPTVGTAVLLARRAAAENGGAHEMMMVLDEKIGPIRCGITIKGRGGHAVFDVPRQSVEAGRPSDRDAIAAALGLVPAEIGFENHQPSVFSAGNAFTFVPVRDRSVLARAAPVEPRWTSAFGDRRASAYLYCRDVEGIGRHFRARSFAPGLGVPEDPATGSAAAAFAGVIRRFDTPTMGTHRYLIEQGFEMGRPSLIGLEIDLEDGEMVASRISGDAVIIAEGTLDL